MAKKLKEVDYKSVPIRGVEGKTIRRVYKSDSGWKSTACRTKIPPLSKLTNFNLKFGDQTLLVLDPYGNELLTEEVSTRIFGGISYRSPGWTIAICRKSGQIYQIGYGTERTDRGSKRKLVAVYWDFYSDGGEEIRVPSQYLDRLDELKSSKRPFCVTFAEHALLNFMTQEYGYNDMRDNLVVRLNFRDISLEIEGHYYREVGRWEVSQTEEAV